MLPVNQLNSLGSNYDYQAIKNIQEQITFDIKLTAMLLHFMLNQGLGSQKVHDELFRTFSMILHHIKIFCQ